MTENQQQVYNQTMAQLSEQQRQIYDLLAAGNDVTTIATRLGSTPALVTANMTRIKNKGLALPVHGEPRAAIPATHVPTDEILAPPVSKPAASGGTENDRIAAVLNSTGGTAISADELRALADKVAGNAAREVHPMILMGVTIQYVKLCGGRIAAHQVIEDVYSALRGFVGIKLPDDESHETVKLPETDKERLQSLELTLKRQQDLIEKLEAKLRNHDPFDASVN